MIAHQITDRQKVHGRRLRSERCPDHSTNHALKKVRSDDFTTTLLQHTSNPPSALDRRGHHPAGAKLHAFVFGSCTIPSERAPYRPYINSGSASMAFRGKKGEN